MMSQKIKISLFFNSLRGIKVMRHLMKIKSIDVSKIIISKKFLNKEIIKILRKKNIKFKYFENYNKRQLNLEHKNIDIGILCGFPIILKENLLNKTKYGFLNCHAGILPNYRGGSPLNWQIINNEKCFGITVLKTNFLIDNGNIILEKKFKLKNTHDINDLHEISNNNFPILVERSINKIIKGFLGKKQSSKGNKLFKQRNEKDSKINLKEIMYEKLLLMVRALQNPYPNPFFFYKNKKMSISNLHSSNKKLSPGEIIIKKNILYIGCRNKTGMSYLKKYKS